MFNNSWPTSYTFVFNVPGRFTFLNAVFSILPASGVTPMFGFDAVRYQSCRVDVNCTVEVMVYDFATGAVNATYNGSVALTSNAGSQVTLPSGPFAWPLGSSRLTLTNLYFRNFTGSQYQPYTLTVRLPLVALHRIWQSLTF